jgi:serine/threonine-protein phosphatase 2B catalytic subunit
MEDLANPLKDRSVNTGVVPIARIPDTSAIFNGELPKWKVLKGLFAREGRISKRDCMTIITKATDIFRREPNLIQLQDPVTVVGDVHGQFYDLLKILDVGGNPETTKYLFLGDYVDRGMFSLEVLLLLYSLKINYPNSIVMIRGNHESRQMTSMFSFRKECISKQDLQVYDLVMASFDALPLACVLNNSFLAIHGGLSPELKTLKDINNINRFIEPPRSGLLCDLLWSDPVDTADGKTPDAYKNNETRGCSFFFGAEATKKILKENDLITIIRGHEVQKDGYKMQFWNGSDFPSIITIFSAPNYCDCYKNKGAIIKFTNGALNIQQYNYSKHPYVLPDFMDVFSWSIPFVIEKVMRILYSVVKPRSKIQGDFDENSLVMIKELEEDFARCSNLKSDHIEQIVSSLRQLREKHERIISNTDGFSDGALIGELVIRKDQITDDSDTFNHAISLDKVNEKRPNA